MFGFRRRSSGSSLRFRVQSSSSSSSSSLSSPPPPPSPSSPLIASQTSLGGGLRVPSGVASGVASGGVPSGAMLPSSSSGLLHRLWLSPFLILFVSLLLAAIGVGALYSASSGSWEPWAGKHLIRIGIGVFLMVCFASVPVWYYRKLAPYGWVLVLLLLLSIEFFGSGRGVQRWLTLGGVNFQPSEPAKLAVVLLLAAYFHTINPELIRNIRTYIAAAIIVLVPFVQVLVQPDLGTSVMLLGSGAAVIFAAGIPLWMIAAIIVLVLMALPVIWSFLYDYQKERILIFINPGADQLGAGYQITQSKIALGSGGVFGKGYLQGSQSRLNYLPEKQTDFVFTMIGEEFGYLGGLFIIGLYVVLVGLLLGLAVRLRYRFSRLMVGGISMMIFLYVFVNIAMVTGLIPVVGAPLPLISYGGTAVLTVFVALGLVLSAVIYDQDNVD